MNLPSSSTSSSNSARKRRAVATAGWTIAFICALDFALGWLFPYPQDPRQTNPGAVALFFDYGRSMEGRLRRATRADPDASAPITQAGWYDPLVATERAAKPGGVEVTVYGMSHAMRLAEALQRVSPRLSVRSVGAPGATTNWSYGAFLRDQGRSDSQVAILAIMSSTLPMITSPAPMNWNTSFALPYTADRFVIDGKGLRQIPPPYDSFDEYVRTLNDPVAWDQALGNFARIDPYYDDVLFRETWLDNSTLVRMVRRGWAQRRDQRMRNDAMTSSGFAPDSEAVRVANAIIADFARRARAEGLIPVVYAVDSFGYDDHLYRAIAGTLKDNSIPYLATHSVIDPGAPEGYLPDSHFTDRNDERLARVMDRIIARELAAQASRVIEQ